MVPFQASKLLECKRPIIIIESRLYRSKIEDTYNVMPWNTCIDNLFKVSLIE